MMKSDFLLFFLIRWKAWHYILHISYIEYLQITIINFDSRPKGSGFEPHRRHCVVVLEQDTFILA